MAADKDTISHILRLLTFSFCHCLLFRELAEQNNGKPFFMTEDNAVEYRPSIITRATQTAVSLVRGHSQGSDQNVFDLE